MIPSPRLPWTHPPVSPPVPSSVLAFHAHCIAAQLERAAVFFTVAWHGFPLVWGAGVLGVVGDARVRLGYVLCDVVAKFLPASIYVSLAVDP